MSEEYVNISPENLQTEHLCCAIGDKKHALGVDAKKAWLAKRLEEGHVFRKLAVKGKVFIEYAPCERAWAPISGDGFLYIYCLWVSGSYANKGYGAELLRYAIEDAKRQGKSGVCVISSKKKKPFFSDKKFFIKFGFEVVDEAGEDYELLSLSFDGKKPCFTESAKAFKIDDPTLTVYYSPECPYTANCIKEVENYCKENSIPLKLELVDSAEKAKSLPCVFNNWAVFYNKNFLTTHLLNENFLKKMLV